MRKLGLILFGVILLSGCKSKSTDEQQWETHDIQPIVEVEVNNGDDDCILDCDYPIKNDLVEADISDFKLGMSRDEILEKIGRQHSNYGSGFWIDLYKIGEGSALFYYSGNDDEIVLDVLVVCTISDCKKLK